MSEKINFHKCYKIFILVFSTIFNIIYFLLCSAIVPAIALITGGFSLNMVFPFFLLLVLPILFFAFLIFSLIKKDNKVDKFFFGLEMPLFFLCLLRIFCLKEFSSFYCFLTVSILISVIFFSLNLFNSKFDNKFFKTLNNFALQIPLLISCYFLLLFSFIFIPFLISVLKFIFSADLILFLRDLFFGISKADFNLSNFLITSIADLYLLLLVIFILLIVCLFFFVPFMAVFTYIKSFFDSYNKHKTFIPCLIFAVVYFCIFLLSSFHFSAFDANEYYTKINSAKSYNELKEASLEVLNKERFIKAILLDDYLAPVRYVFDDFDSVSFIGKSWNDVGFSEEAAKGIQKTFLNMAFPFSYLKEYRSTNTDSIYEELFDDDIQSDNAKRILKAVNSTFFTKNIGASLVKKASSNVKVLSREIRADKIPNSSIYKISFVDTYKNSRPEDEEVYIDFSLPDTAIITSLYLGNNLEFKGVLSPKGAARKTYNAQLIRQKDPALLEKNGVYQYTLRVFPVEYCGADNKTQKVKFEYLIVPKNGFLYLPNIYEARNAYFGAFSSYSVYLNGKKLNNVHNKSKIQIDTTNAKTINLKNKKLAVLMDTSFSNKNNWSKFLKDNIKEILDENDTEYYFFNKFLSDKLGEEEILKQINFSKTAKYDAYCSLKDKYDAVIMLTDSGRDFSSFDTCKNDKNPLFVVHIDEFGKIPPYNIKFTNLIYKTNGDIGSDIIDIFEKISTDNNKPYFSKTKSSEEKAFNALYDIDKILRTENLDNFKTKEKIYNIANKAGIVTPYSSYIALVNSNQHKLLKHNKTKKDKFDADLEVRKEEGLVSESKDNNSNSNGNVEAVPEPGEWVFIIMFSILILFFIFKNRLRCLF